MNFKCLISAAALVATSSLVHAQPVPYWIKVDPRPLNYWDTATAAVFTANGDGFVLGATQDFPEGAGDPEDVNGIRLTKFSSTGNVLWASQISRPTAYGPVQTTIIPTPDGGALTYVDWETGLRYDDLILTKYGSNGAVQWSDTSDICPAVSPDGSVFTSTSFDGEVIVKKLNAQGTLLWEKVTETTNSYFSALKADVNGGVWAAGSSFVNNAPQIYLGHFDTDGNMQTWTIPTFGMGTTHIDFDSSGNLVLGGVLPGSNSTQVIALAKVSPTGTLLWSNVYSDPVDYSYYSKRPTFTIDPAGNVYVGYNSSASPHPQVMKVTPDGNTAWAHTFAPANTYATLTDVVADPGSNLFLLCSVTANGSFNSNDALIKYLPNGSIGWSSLPDGAIILDSGQFDTGANGGGDIPAGLGRDSSGFLYIGGLALLDNRDGVAVVKYGPANNSVFVTQTAPSTMVAGQTYTITETFQNNGVNPWTFNAGYYLRSQNPTDTSRWGRTRVDLGNSDTIAPGQSKKFSFFVYAPVNGGTYPLQWRMSQGTSVFGMPSANVNVAVALSTTAARYVSQSVPATVKAGTTFSVSVDMRNVGTNTWTQAGGYNLATTSPDLNTTWGFSSVALAAADSIARGQDKTFRFNCHAPTTPGTYTLQLRMRKSSTFFGDKTTVKTITVTP